MTTDRFKLFDPLTIVKDLIQIERDIHNEGGSGCMFVEDLIFWKANMLKEIVCRQGSNLEFYSIKKGNIAIKDLTSGLFIKGVNIDTVLVKFIKIIEADTEHGWSRIFNRLPCTICEIVYDSKKLPCLLMSKGYSILNFENKYWTDSDHTLNKSNCEQIDVKGSFTVDSFPTEKYSSHSPEKILELIPFAIVNKILKGLDVNRFVYSNYGSILAKQWFDETNEYYKINTK